MANYTLASTAAQVDAAVAAVNDRQIITLFGDFGLATGIPSAIGYCCLSVFGGIVDISLHVKIMESSLTSTVYTSFSTALILEALGASSITWNPKQTEVRVDFKAGIEKVCPAEADLGYGGLVAFTNGTYIGIGRHYTQTGGYGSWSLANNLLDVHNTIHIRVMGAAYTI